MLKSDLFDTFEWVERWALITYWHNYSELTSFLNIQYDSFIKIDFISLISQGRFIDLLKKLPWCNRICPPIIVNNNLHNLSSYQFCYKSNLYNIQIHKWIFQQNNSTSPGAPPRSIYMPPLWRLAVDTFYAQSNSLLAHLFVKALLYMVPKRFFKIRSCIIIIHN